jgi:hypothetical protein
VLEDDLAGAQQVAAAVGVGDDTTPVTAAFDAAEAKVRGSPELLARVRERRARWALDASLPEVALRDLEAAPRTDLELQLLRYLAGRRAAGPAAEAAEQDALAALRAGQGTLGVVARALSELAPIEERRTRSYSATIATDADDAAATTHARELVAPLEAAVKDRPDLALVREALGRALVVGVDVGRGLQSFVEAAQLDPADPEPRVRLFEAYVTAYGNHHRTRWVAAWWTRQAEYATRLTRRADPLLTLCELELRGHSRAGALDPAERILGAPRPETPRQRRARYRAVVYAARARLDQGLDPGEELLALEPVDGVFDLHRQVLVAWARLRKGEHEAGLAMLEGVLSRLDRFDLVLMRDLAEGASSAEPPLPLASLQRLLEALERSAVAKLGFLDQGRVYVQVALARSAALGGDQSDLLDAIAASTQGDPGSWLDAERGLSLARCYQSYGQADRAHREALFAWARVGLEGDDLSSTARAARTLLIDQLRRSGREAAAKAFEAVPSTEPSTPRVWSPPPKGAR